MCAIIKAQKTEKFSETKRESESDGSLTDFKRKENENPCG